MVYTADSPLLGSGSASAAQIQAWLAAHAEQGASYVKLPVAQLPPDLGQAILDECRAAGVNSDLVAAQVAHESSYAQSDFARNRNNYAGIGAINADPGQAITFPSPRAGVHAQVSHLLTYIKGADNPLKADDPRYAAAQAAGYLGVAKVLTDLDGRWAWPGQGYGAAVAAQANDLLSFAAKQGSTSNVSVSDFYGVPLAWMPAAEGNYDTSRGKVRLFIVHDEEASTAMSAVNRFQTPGQQASSHFVTDPANGRIIQCVGTGNTAYTCGNYALNQVSVNVENPGFEGKPYPDSVVDYCARCGAYCVQKFGIPIVRLSKSQVAAGQAGFCGHEDIPDPDHPGLWGGTDHHTDPGATWPWDKFLNLMRQYAGQGGAAQPQAVTPPAPITPPPAPQGKRYFPETKHTLSGGFRAFWESEPDALKYFGMPISEEFDMTFPDGKTWRVQYFERERFEWHPKADPAHYDVLLGLLGSESIEQVKAQYADAFQPVPQ